MLLGICYKGFDIFIWLLSLPEDVESTATTSVGLQGTNPVTYSFSP